MTGDFRSDLEPAVEQTEAAILKIIQGVVPSARLARVGPIGFDPPTWSCWVVTKTDAEKNRLSSDAGLNERLAAAVKTGFPPDSFTYQSEETVARDYEGSWFYAMR